MKKMRNKKGFTLAEVLIVIAIIVILAGATAVGVVSWLNNAKNAQNNVLSNNGDNFENAARLAVETANGTAPAWVGESATVNPVTTTTTEATTTKKEDPIDDPDPETTPATTPSTTPATTPSTTPATTSANQTHDGSDTSFSNVSKGGYEYWENNKKVGYYHQDGATLNFGFTVTSSAIIVVPEGTKNFTINNYKYKLTYLGDNKYKIEFVRPDQTPDNSIEIHHDYLGQNANDSAISQIRVESYS